MRGPGTTSAAEPERLCSPAAPGPAGPASPPGGAPGPLHALRPQRVPVSPAEHSPTQRWPGLTCRAVRHAQHRTQCGEGAQGLAAALFAHGEHVHPAAGRRAGHEQHVLAAAEVRRFLLARHYSLRPERVKIVKLHHGPEKFRRGSGEAPAACRGGAQPFRGGQSRLRAAPCRAGSGGGRGTGALVRGSVRPWRDLAAG